MEGREGWTVETLYYGTIIGKPGCGYVTIDFKARTFSVGIGPVYHPLNTTKYSGKGWREALMTDATNYLDEVTR